MNTTIFTTTYLAGQDGLGNHRLERTINWMRYHRKFFGPEISFVLCDNGSPHVAKRMLENAVLEIYPNLMWSCFEDHLPKKGSGSFDYPYCWRGLFGLSQFIELNPQLDKIIFLDNDIYVLSEKLKNFMLDLPNGFVCFKEEFYNFNTSEMFVLCQNKFEDFRKFFQDGWEQYCGRMMEATLPFMRAEDKFKYGRYGERDYPVNSLMDAYGQMRVKTSTLLLEQKYGEKGVRDVPIRNGEKQISGYPNVSAANRPDSKES